MFFATIELDAPCGADITRTIRDAIALAAKYDRLIGDVSHTVTFDFNGVRVKVDANSDASLIFRDWERGMLRPSGSGFVAGPWTRPTLSPADVAEDARLTAERDARIADLAETARKSREADAAVLSGALSVAPPIAIRDEAAWQKYKDANTDLYGGACVRYAETWARLMQGQMLGGSTLAECASECSRVADVEGITGFMYGAAVSILAACWEHGEELRRWHNRDTQIGDEGDRANESGGVLNPALLSIG